MSNQTNISCKEAVNLVLLQEENKVSTQEKLLLQKHLSECILCQRFSDQNVIMNKALSEKEFQNVTHLTNDEKDKIIKAAV